MIVIEEEFHEMHYIVPLAILMIIPANLNIQTADLSNIGLDRILHIR